MARDMRIIANTHPQLHTTLQKVLLSYKTIDLFFCVSALSHLWLLFSLLTPSLCFYPPPTQLQICTVKIPTRPILPICSVADSDYAPPASHLSRVYPNMKINSQLNAAICSPRGRGEEKSNTGLHWWTESEKESLKAGRAVFINVQSKWNRKKEKKYIHKPHHINRGKSPLIPGNFNGHKKLTQIK